MSIKSVVSLLVVVCIAASVNAQLPQLPPLPFPFPFPNPFQPSPGMPALPNPFHPSPGMPGMPDMSKCWSTVMDLPGCFQEIQQAVMTGKFGSIGPACCKAFLDAEANCTPNLPFNPFFPPMVKQKCSKSASPPTTAH
ncbi:Prolamin-like domain [Arabidopsis thaliana x Arabidopsis arenosa]|uniref:Prolamin-like domain n=1 Tax=Arabidopsis thaliana x Arabidopsis arenosa TaxID=1240361 RepID=A0A8T1XPQ8_9BRAS|nr:Prolamin-like domain [Arabidopsis thaliana x Arabidopsis arenosa]